MYIGYWGSRADCHASAIKYLKKMNKIDANGKDVKVDLLLFNNDCGDIFACEDRPLDSAKCAVKADIRKGQELSEKRLMHIQSLLPLDCLITNIEVISAQFYGLNLMVYGSRITEFGDYIYYDGHLERYHTFTLGVMLLRGFQSPFRSTKSYWNLSSITD